MGLAFPANMGHTPNVVSMLGQQRRQWPNIETALSECLVFVGWPEDGAIYGQSQRHWLKVTRTWSNQTYLFTLY